MKSWSCIEFVFIQLSLTGLPSPVRVRQFIAWRRQPQNPDPSNDDPEPPKEAGRVRGLAVFDRNPAIVRLAFIVAPVGGSGQQSWWFPLDFTSPGAYAPRL